MKTQRNIILLLTLILTSLCGFAQSGLIVKLKNGETMKFPGASVNSLTFEAAEEPEPGAAPKIGDFYYSDGTWSSLLDDSKTPIAIVYYVGDPTVDDATLRAEHPECTHGLAIALKETVCAWQAKYETYGASRTVSDWLVENGYPSVLAARGIDSPVNKMVGYSFSKSLRAFNASPDNAAWPVNAIAAVDEYAAAVPAPDITSGWFLGSGRELVLACFGQISGDIIEMGRQDATIRDIIQGKLQELPADEVDLFNTSGWSYWTSCEYGLEGEVFWQERSWNVYFTRNKNSVSASFKAWDEFVSARPILAF